MHQAAAQIFSAPYSIVNPTLGQLALPRHVALFLGLAMLSGVIVRAMISVGVPDRPDARKAHQRITPKSGGVGIVATFLLGIVLLYRYGHVSRLVTPAFLGMIGAAALIAIVSFLDDLRNFRFGIKLAAQCVAAVLAVAVGIWPHSFALPVIGNVALGPAGPVLGIVWILFVTNAMNFIDGMDGLAAGSSLIACLFLAGFAGVHGGFFVYTTSLLLAGGVAGFLPFNWPKARIFMGDVGSQFCGFILALLGIAAAEYHGLSLSFLIVPLLLSGVLLDVTFTLLRRAVQGESLTRPHRGHLYQVAHRTGLDPRGVAIIYWGFTVFGGITVIVFMKLSGLAKIAVVAAPLLPFAAWAGFVGRRARQVQLGRWG